MSPAFYVYDIVIASLSFDEDSVTTVLVFLLIYLILLYSGCSYCMSMTVLVTRSLLHIPVGKNSDMIFTPRKIQLMPFMG